MKKKILLILTFLSSFIILPQKEDHAFIKSFVDCYDFRPEGRYTHEYHDFSRKRTAESFSELEERLKKEEMKIDGRIFIVGYEGEAVPSYYTDYKKAKINDEASSLGKVGWSLRLHNKFGLMTGFLFKDLDELGKSYSKNSSVFEHVNPYDVEIFNDDSGIFQQHAFGEAYDLMLDYKDVIEKSLKVKDPKDILSLLQKFWRDLYLNEAKTSSGQLSATQDILFSIEYADYLLKSDLSILKYFTGPDITYPIETSIKQEKEATKNAQQFLPTFVSSLKPIDDEPTVYVFDSFVDGVGKSTMLGNVKNWMKYKDQIDKYERVDNSSSQYSELFKFSNNVFIADLPAQVSHFVYKPDGFVYVDAETEKTKEELKKVAAFVVANKEELWVDYNNLCDEVEEKMAKEGCFENSINDINYPKRMFIKNLLLFGRDVTNAWLPFEYEGEDYLFNYFDPFQLRILCSLGSVASHGLKNIEEEQMIFSCVKFPFAYKTFLDDFMQKLKSQNIKRVVFVDFLSMYPRSSRENVRINYLLQQLSLLDPSFSIEQSLYKKFISGSQLLSDLVSPSRFSMILRSMQLEVALRLSLFRIISEQGTKSLEGIKLSDLTNILRAKISSLGGEQEIVKQVEEMVEEKLIDEKNSLFKLFGRSKDFVNVQQFSFDLVVKFSNIIRKLFGERILNPRLNNLWDDLEGDVAFVEDCYEGYVDRNINLSSGAEVVDLYEFFPECRNTVYLAPFFKTLRCAFYATLANLLASQVDSNGDLVIENEIYQVPPMLVKNGENGQVYLVQKLLEPWEEGDIAKEWSIDTGMFYLRKKLTCGKYLGFPYSLDFDNAGTNFGIYSFGCMAARAKNDRHSFAASAVTRLVRRYQEEMGAGTVMPTSKLYKQLLNSGAWQKEKDEMRQQAESNGEFKISYLKELKKASKRKRRVFKATQEQVVWARLMVRMLATLEMILKDADADVVVRKGKRKDFVAVLKLFEEITLPKYFGILFTKPLFDAYDSVSPVIPWEYFEED